MLNKKDITYPNIVVERLKYYHRFFLYVHIGTVKVVAKCMHVKLNLEHENHEKFMMDIEVVG